MLKITIFAVVSVGIVFVSWSSFRDPHTHGFFRFFAFETLLVLVLLNVGEWFRNPFSATQIASWILLLCSTILAVHGFYLLLTVGKPKGGVENTTVLVVLGAYKYIRHPLYSSLLFGGCGVFFKDPSYLGGILFLASSIFVIVTAKAEESENLRKFGPVYASYMKTTKMFIPFVS